MQSNYRKIGDFIQRISVRNTNGELSLLQGIKIDKYFMPSVANVVGTDLTRYKVVKPNQFSCNRMHVGRDERLPIALSTFNYDIIVSPAYDVFEIIDTDKLNSEYLMMWFSRSEFDRNCWFYTDTDVRGKLGWDSLCEMELPIPSIEKQKEIVAEYNTIVNRIKLNEQLNQKLEETAQAIYKHWFVDFEFPNDKGKPYKSSGGKMVFNEELDKDVPVEWGVKRMDEISEVIDSLHKTPIYSSKGYPMVRVTDINRRFLNLSNTLKVSKNIFDEFTKKYTPKKNDILMSRVGTYGISTFVGTKDNFCLGQNTIVIIPKKVGGTILFSALNDFYVKKQIEELVTGSTQKTISLKSIRSLKFILPNNVYSKISTYFIKLINKNLALGNVISSEIGELSKIKDLLLSKMLKI